MEKLKSLRESLVIAALLILGFITPWHGAKIGLLEKRMDQAEILPKLTKQTLVNVVRSLSKEMQPVAHEQNETQYDCPVCGSLLGIEWIVPGYDGVVLDAPYAYYSELDKLHCKECGYEWYDKEGE